MERKMEVAQDLADLADYGMFSLLWLSVPC